MSRSCTAYCIVYRVMYGLKTVKDTAIVDHVVTDLVVVFLHSQHLVRSLPEIDQIEIELRSNL